MLVLKGQCVSSSGRRRFAGWASAGCSALLLAASSFGTTTTFTLVPRDLGSGLSFGGTVVTDGTVGMLTAANLVGWNITVRQVDEWSFTPANTMNRSSGVRSDGSELLVPTSPDGIDDGGSLAFFAGHRFGVEVADFTGPNVGGGQAYYVAGSAFEARALGVPDATDYVAAKADAAGGGVYDLTPVRFPGGAVLSGTVTTDGTVGPANLIDWDITVRQETRYVFNQRNSRVLGDTGLATDGVALTVTPFDENGDPGSLFFGYGLLDLTGVAVADFTVDPSGAAGFVSPFLFEFSGGLPVDAEGRVVVGASVPDSGTTLSYFAFGLGAVGTAAFRCSRRTVGRPAANGTEQ